MNNKWKVYMHTSPNNKRYIGITSRNSVKRLGNNGEGYKYNAHFWRAIQKYGWNEFSHEILCSGLTEQRAKELEIYFIAKYKTTDSKYGYNIAHGGDGTNGYHHSEETKRKIGKSNRHSKQPMKEETKIKISNSLKGIKRKPMSDETKEKIRKSKLGSKHGPLSEETKEKIRLARLGYKMSDEQKEKLRTVHLGKKYSEEHREKMRIAQQYRRQREKDKLKEVF